MAKIIESRLTFIKRTCLGKHPRAIYKCVCGAEKEIIMHAVTKGFVVSCGCYDRERRKTHGLSGHPLYAAWANIKDRCYNPNAENYSDYGGRGVKMFEPWIDDFKAFYDWCMAKGWKPGLHIDKDIKGFNLIYSPDTIVLASALDNNNAKRNNRFVEFAGQIKTIAEWCRIYGIRGDTLGRRLKGATKIVDENLFRKPRFKAKNGESNVTRKK